MLQIMVVTEELMNKYNVVINIYALYKMPNESS